MRLVQHFIYNTLCRKYFLTHVFFAPLNKSIEVQDLYSHHAVISQTYVNVHTVVFTFSLAKTFLDMFNDLSVIGIRKLCICIVKINNILNKTYKRTSVHV